MTAIQNDVTPPGRGPLDRGPLGRGPLRRSRTDHVLGGVCSGVARQLGVDPTFVRIAVMALTFVSFGTATVAYLIAWVLIPQGDDTPPVPAPANDLGLVAGGTTR